MAVVEVVGVIPSVQTSAGFTGTQAKHPDSCANGLSGFSRDNDKLQFRGPDCEQVG